ncbi:unnamed protein product [Cylicocyclus nassatus]|uniref:Uncharacterized protein n=1 Tax=Cylicocyclus nassatus TaxID=53992 RepID=A0AA36MDC0_CYLNA|nr:unnamed protein product [Cylicocyclus nassatus]
MHFEKPTPEDFDIDLPLKEAGCLITVRKCRDFNDETAHRLFPQSSASYVASHTYTIPSNYFSETFWKKEEKRLTNIRRIWAANRHRLSSEDLEGPKLLVCKADVQKILDMCDWLMHMQWDGDRSQPPMPLHLYKARLNELKNENDFVVKRLQSICEEEKPSKARINEIRSHFTTKDCLPEKSRGSDTKENEKPGQSRSWKITMMERINDILGILDAAASAGENVAQALTMLMVIRQCIKKGKDSYEDVRMKMEKLDELVADLRKASKANEKKVSPSTGKKPLAKSTASVINTPTATTVRKRGRPKSLKSRDDEEYAEKRKSMPATVNTEKCAVETETTDDLVSRVKRGQRTRRPARAFTPGWELSPSPSPPPPPSRFRNSPKPLDQEQKQAAGSKSLSPDSGRPSSNESSDTAATSMVQTSIVTTVTSEVQPSVSQEKSADVQNLSTSPASLPPPVSYTNSAPPSTPCFANFSTPTINNTVTPKVVLSPPPLPQLSEQAVMAILKERVQLGDVRLTLLNLYSNDAIPTYHFVPVMIELAEKAIAALDNKDMIVYAMYKAALDAGCAQLGTIMRASNPSDPTKQIANLATSMGISPSQFTAMVQPPTNTTPMASNALSSMQTGAYPTLPQDYPLNAYPVVGAPVDTRFQGYVERDISSFLL